MTNKKRIPKVAAAVALYRVQLLTINKCSNTRLASDLRQLNMAQDVHGHSKRHSKNLLGTLWPECSVNSVPDELGSVVPVDMRSSCE